MSRPRKNQFLWLEVTSDRYQLPLAVADSRRELAEMRHTTVDAISDNIYQAKQGKVAERYIRIEVEEDGQ